MEKTVEKPVDFKEELTIKINENLKRENELNALIKMKFKECESVLGKKNCEEIICIFRSKLNVINDSSIFTSFISNNILE